MEKIARQRKLNFHLAGIIPVAGLPLDFKMPWHDSLMPIAPDYLAVERSVYECGVAGCETIWIVCHKEMTPLIRHKIGDYVLDPTLNFSLLRKYYKRAEENIKRIPIYYLPIHPKDRGIRDGLTWSIIYGYKRAYHISRTFSRWATPSKYYVSFPYGVYSPSLVKQARKTISSKQSVFLRTPSGFTAKDGAYIGFSFDTWEYSKYRESFLNAETRMWKSGKWEDGKFVGERLPKEERFNGSKIPLNTFLEKADLEEKAVFDIDWHFDISSWDNYCNFLSSKERTYIRRPKFGLKYNEFNPFAHDDIELDTDTE
jgi:hypothetical protein